MSDDSPRHRPQLHDVELHSPHPGSDEIVDGRPDDPPDEPDHPVENGNQNDHEQTHATHESHHLPRTRGTGSASARRGGRQASHRPHQQHDPAVYQREHQAESGIEYPQEQARLEHMDTFYFVLHDR